ncbi:hypothetical protein CSUB01_07282 [Colletotrichum sublineola]|uniref:G domain-containing protein n=1 Tax=Colletotrichum sublineola TaxID=1173701 RepID=A0A066WYZ9_COLSU|nr:hypothetical protein CSUB01_07282 [Colletotrichum sublineola]
MGSKSSDIIIAVMGVTGSGKSTFISQLTGQEVPIGHGLRSLTAITTVYKYCHPVYGNIHIIDTPGFDDTVTSDTDVLKNIAAFMSESYKKGTLLTGVVYMHKITDNRVSGSSQRSINMFKKLCGDDSFKHVVLTTSMWGEGDADAATINRETELKEDKRFWGLMQSGGSKVMRQMHGLTTLQIQRELVEENRDLEETSAGQEVGRELLKERMKMLQEVEDLKKDHENALLAKDSENAEKFRKDKQEMESKLQKAEEAQKALRIDLEQLLREKTEEYEIKQKELRDQMAQADHLATKRGKELEKLNKDLKQSKITYQELRREFAADLRRQEELERKVEKSKSRKKLLKALIPSMFGVGIIGLGIATANPLLMMSGGALVSGAAAGGAGGIS